MYFNDLIICMSRIWRAFIEILHNTGPHGYSGPIKKSFVSCMDHLPESFEPILFAGASPTIDRVNDWFERRSALLEDNLCCDRRGQFVLTTYSITKSIKLSHARWLITGSTILHLYVSARSLTKNVKNLATFVMALMKVYAQYEMSKFSLKREYFIYRR